MALETIQLILRSQKLVSACLQVQMQTLSTLIKYWCAGEVKLTKVILLYRGTQVRSDLIATLIRRLSASFLAISINIARSEDCKLLEKAVQHTIAGK